MLQNSSNTDKPSIQDPVLKALHNQHNAILVTGNNIFDLQVELENDNDIFFRPKYVAEKLFNQNFHVIRYSRSSGLSVHAHNKIEDSLKSELDNLLKKAGVFSFLASVEISPTEVIEIFRGFKQLASITHNVPLVFIIDYAPHLAGHESPTVEEKIVAETINDISSLPAVIKSGNILLVYAHDESKLSSLLKGLYRVQYGYPSLDEYEHFFNILSSRSDEFASSEMDSLTLAKLSRGLNLTQIAGIFKEAKSINVSVSKDAILREKERLIEQVSENTLNVLATNRSFDDFAGLEVTKDILSGFAQKLSIGDASSPRAILLAGPPGTGKTTLVSAFANSCAFNLVELSDSIKSKWVGESESRLNIALGLIEALSPVILFIDEIDQSLSNRSSSNLDGGVSSHYLKTLFKFIARDELRGKICIVACSNTPQLLDPAMINRFVTIPMLESTPEQIAKIFPKIEEKIVGKKRLNPENEDLLAGSELLYSKGASPRQIFDIINHTIMNHGFEYSEIDILKSCKRFRRNGDPYSGAYSSLSAINLTAFEDYLPWANNPKTYKYPEYLEGVVDSDSGEINEQELTKKLNEYSKLSKF